jgi:hypothetical protein
MGTLDYQNPDLGRPQRWRRLYMVGVPVFAVVYTCFTLVYALGRSQLFGMWPYFPLPLLVPNGPPAIPTFLRPFISLRAELLVGLIVLLIANGVMWGMAFVAACHSASWLWRAMVRRSEI